MKYTIGNKVYLRDEAPKKTHLITDAIYDSDRCAVFPVYELDNKECWFFESELELANDVEQHPIDKDKYEKLLYEESNANGEMDASSRKIQEEIYKIGKEEFYNILLEHSRNEELVKAITRYKSAVFNYKNAIKEIKEMRDSIQE